MIVFEPELWEGSALLPSGKVRTRYGAAAAAAGNTSASGTSASGKTTSGTSAFGTPAPGKSSNGLKLWDGGSFDFHDILDVINPLQHLPVVNSIYRAEAGDEIGAVPRILGSMLYGGGLIGALIGAASAIVNIVVEHETGKDLGQHIYTALFGEGSASRRSTQLAAPKTGDIISGETKAGGGPNAASGVEAAKAAAAAAAVPGALSAQGAESAHGANKITPKAHAALQAFVAGLAKNASPAAAAAVKSAIAQSAVRIAGITAPGAAAIGGAANGATTKTDVSSQFRRADWYQRNQAVLKAQAAALAKHQAAAKSTARTAAPAAKTNTTDAASAILQLFTTPGGSTTKPASKSAGPGTGAASSTKAAPAASVPPAKPAATGRGAVAGPWVANEIANALSKYETLVKTRNAAAAAK